MSFSLPLTLAFRHTNTLFFSSDASLSEGNYFSDSAHPCYSSNILACTSFDFVAGVVEAWYFKTLMGIHALSHTDRAFCFGNKPAGILRDGFWP